MLRIVLAALAAFVGLGGAAALAQGEPGRAPGDVFRDCEAACPELVVVPAGAFQMGSPADEAGRRPDEGPQRRVTIVRPLAIGRFEVTFDEWDACVAAGGCATRDGEATVAGDAGWGRGRRPVIFVSWRDAEAYLAWLSARTGRRYRLPTEAEWEYAARAGRQDDAAPAGRHGAQDGTAPVGGFAANAFGLFDTTGNVWEWTADCYGPYAKAPVDGTASGAGDCTRRVLRGGAWNITGPVDLRPAARGRNRIDYRDNDFGFRVVRELAGDRP